MPRRTSLKAVATGLATSFASRNNDVAGYWGMGVLRTHAAETGTHELLIDLVHEEAHLGYPSPVSEVAAHFRKRLHRQMEAFGLNKDWLARARVFVRFEVPEANLSRYERFGRGHPFECVVELTDDRGRTRTFEAHGKVEPHDPRRERRSARREKI